MSLQNLDALVDQFQKNNGLKDEDLLPPAAMFALALVTKNGVVVLNPNDLKASRIALFADGNRFINYAEATLTAAQIILLFTTPVAVVAAPGADKAIELISATVIYKFATAAYGAGGALSIAFSGGSDVSSVISAANSFGAAGDKVTQCSMLDTANGIPLLVNTGLVIKAATANFTNPGTAAGIARIKVAYRVHTLGLA